MSGGAESSRAVEPGAGEGPSFAQIYAELFPFVWRMARRLGVVEAALDDVCQDVFVIVHRRLGDFEGRSSLKSWVFGILHNVVLVHRRSLARKSPPRHRTEPPVEPEALAHPGRSPQEDAAFAEDARLAQAILEELDEDKRTVLVLVEIEEMTVPEVADALGLNVNTTAARLRAARKQFALWMTRHRARERWRTP